MKLKTTREVTKTEEIELDFTQWDALELVSQYRYKKKNDDYYQIRWNGLLVEIEYFDNVYHISISDTHNLYKRFDVTFTSSINLQIRRTKMIHAEISDSKNSKKIDYPILMKNTYTGAIFLFTAPTVGMVIGGKCVLKLGDYRDGTGLNSWNDQSMPEHWEVFTGEISLSNAD